MKEKRILITGSKGFIGSHLMRLVDGVGYDLKSGQDVRDKEQLESYIKGADYVVHLAAQTSIAHAWNDPTDYYSHNILGTSNVIELALKHKVKIIYASSASVYQPFENPYSLSKYVCEKMLELRKPDVVAFRFMNVYGKGQNKNYGTVIPAFYEGFKSKKGIKIYGDGNQTRDFIHVKDIVMAIKMVIDKDFKGTYIMDLGTGKSISVNKLADMYEELFKRKVKRNHIPERPEVKHSKADTSKVKRFLEFIPHISLKEGLKMTMEEGI